jgi:2-methylisocitrate lyase-like PEP mutase family enzyme
VTSQADKAARFLELHEPGSPLLMPNAWDAGSAKLLVSLGFHALATTSSGHAASLGRLDGSVTRNEALAHAAELVAAVDVPVSADLEDCFGSDAEGVAETIRGARAAGLAGCSIEDATRERDEAIYPFDEAVERVRAAAAAAHEGDVRLVLTARSENYLHGRPDIEDTLARLRAYQEAGADVLYAPGVKDPAELRRITSELDRPVNALALPGVPPVSELASLGVARVSVGGGFAFAALGALVEAAEEIRDRGTYGYFERTAVGGRAARRAFG